MLNPQQIGVYDMLGHVCFNSSISDNQYIFRPELRVGVYIVNVGQE